MSKPQAGSAITLRAMEVTDLTAITALEHELFGADAWSADALAGELSRADRIYRVAVDAHDGTIMGYAGMWLGDPLQVMTVAVAPSAQGRGIGKAIMNDLLALSAQVVKKFAPAEMQDPQVSLEVRASNTVAQNLYTTLGFIRSGVRKAYYRNEDAIVMSRKLNPEGNDHE